MVEGTMKIEEAMQVVLALAEESADDNAITDYHMRDAERKELAQKRQAALDMVRRAISFARSARPQPAPPTRPQVPKVLIWMEGGLIQDIGASHEVELVVIDEDTEGGDEENIRTIKLFGDDKGEREFYVNDWGEIEATPEWAEHYFNQARKEKPESEQPQACTLETEEEEG